MTHQAPTLTKSLLVFSKLIFASIILFCSRETMGLKDTELAKLVAEELEFRDEE